MSAPLVLPLRKVGYQSPAAKAQFRAEVQAFCEAIREIRRRRDYSPARRTWSYLLEGKCLVRGHVATKTAPATVDRLATKADFILIEKTITELRESGDLPLDITSMDETRAWSAGLPDLEDESVHEEDVATKARDYIDVYLGADDVLAQLKLAHRDWEPFPFWAAQPVYVMALVEKSDLYHLFKPIADEFHIPIASGRGSSDLHNRVTMIQHFKEAEEAGQQPVLLYGGDLDVHGELIARFLPSHIARLSTVRPTDDLPPLGWTAENLIIDQFCITADQAEEFGIGWIDGLVTSSGKDLGDDEHHFASHQHVQAYIEKYGKRKIEANALSLHVEASRELFRKTVLKYIDMEAEAERQRQNREAREALRLAILAQIPDALTAFAERLDEIRDEPDDDSDDDDGDEPDDDGDGTR